MSNASSDNGGIHLSRIDGLQGAFEDREIDTLLVTSPSNRLYLSGFTGSSANLLIAGDRRLLITDGRYLTQAASQAADYELVIHTGPLLEQVAASARDMGTARLGFDPALTTVADFETLSKLLEPDCELAGVSGLVEGLRLLKDEAEMEALRRAIAIGDAAMEVAEEAIRPGVREIDVAIAIEQEFRLAGASGPSFPVIVASGRNAAMPHHSPTVKEIEEGDSVVVDMGAKLDGYCSDMTRTFCAGGPTPMFEKIYGIVLEAQQAAIDGVRGGLSAKDCDGLARDVISAAGYGDKFGHGTGHGVGLDIHESPRVSFTSKDVLQAGMVHSVEPGIYLPDWGGVRIEDLVLVTEDGSETLSRYPK